MDPDRLWGTEVLRVPHHHNGSGLARQLTEHRHPVRAGVVAFDPGIPIARQKLAGVLAQPSDIAAYRHPPIVVFLDLERLLTHERLAAIEIELVAIALHLTHRHRPDLSQDLCATIFLIEVRQLDAE